MITPLKAVALVVRDLLGHPEALIKFGRLNAERDDFSLGYIAIDAMSAAVPATRGHEYNGSTEEMTYEQDYRMPITLDFFGTDAWLNAQRFAVLLGSYSAYELQRANEITIGGATGMTDVQALTGHQFGNQVQVDLTIHFAAAQCIETLRIDTSQIKFIED